MIYRYFLYLVLISTPTFCYAGLEDNADTSAAASSSQHPQAARASVSYLKSLQLTDEELGFVHQYVSQFRQRNWTVCWKTVVKALNEKFGKQLDPENSVLRDKLNNYCLKKDRKARLSGQRPATFNEQLRKLIKEAILKFIEEGGEASAGDATSPAQIPWVSITRKYMPGYHIDDVRQAFRCGIDLKRELYTIIAERAEKFPSANWKGWVLSFKSRIQAIKKYDDNRSAKPAPRRRQRPATTFDQLDHDAIIHTPKRVECEPAAEDSQNQAVAPLPGLLDETLDPFATGQGCFFQYADVDDPEGANVDDLLMFESDWRRPDLADNE